MRRPERALGGAPRAHRLAALALTGLALAALLSLAACSEKKKTPSEEGGDRIDHRGGIAVIPRGRVVVATAKGEQFLLEVEAPVTLDQALAFYRNQLPRDRWEDLRTQEVSPGLWGLQARRGMFELTGRIKRLDAQRVSIGFERRVRAQSAGWIPPVPTEVVTLPEAIRWEDRVFDSGGVRVELRGRSEVAAEALSDRLKGALQASGWTVEQPGPGRLRAHRKVGKAVRELLYRLEALPKGTQVALSLALDELATKRRPTTPDRPTPRPDAGAAENLVPVPKDLVLWKDGAPPAARRDSEGLFTVTFERPCKPLEVLRAETEALLVKRGFKPLPKTEIPGATGDLAPTSVTATKGKRLVVAIVSREVAVCTVSLMVTDK